MYLGRDQIARLRREMGMKYIQKRKLQATTNSAHSLPVPLQPQIKRRAPRSAVKPVHVFSQLLQNDNREKHAVLRERFQPGHDL
ncbi:MAG: hypothetical protein EA384_00105 [Spirochaetaceae bacterium]|nr:MAG: hypothetical protein EA384_00105 [Spirochaetaceae bacterium]